MKLSYIHENIMRHSHECITTVVRVSYDYRTTVMRCICKIGPNFVKLSHKCPFKETATESCVYIVNLCHEILAN